MHHSFTANRARFVCWSWSAHVLLTPLDARAHNLQSSGGATYLVSLGISQGPASIWVPYRQRGGSAYPRPDQASSQRCPRCRREGPQPCRRRYPADRLYRHYQQKHTSVFQLLRAAWLLACSFQTGTGLADALPSGRRRRSCGRKSH